MPKHILLPCRDGYQLAAQLWLPPGEARGSVIVSSATGVLARYYARYAGFLREQGYTVLTYDYRGIGGSRPANLRGAGIRWRDWGDYDFDAAVRWMRQRDPDGLLVAVGHSIGGFMPGFARAATEVDRFLSVGAQYAYWRDYAPAQRWQMFARWHLFMPAVTALYGYFPGRRLGWLEDLPAGVAHEWAFRRARLEASYPLNERDEVLQRFAAIRAPILAVSVTDDEYGTPPALRRGLDYYRNSHRQHVQLSPEALGMQKVGHFDLFRERHRDGFWQSTLEWIGKGHNPWPLFEALAPEAPAIVELVTDPAADPG
ncbi:MULTISPECIES: alpha/beta fold hydrolase [Pseudomonadaceae]|uniref:alpha/beta hydrolase family protein n=1 Tax=Pseudomonadaceae TaxID=135621 RepID=UPI0015E2A0BD|nr:MULTISPECIES: alpha/beta fold hydrolase [Pseudomonadaceae]MBA1278166.1 alpha/beta fold hydrolase [Stutzerimonas stutzeri]MBC8650335.1 alpha/beta fold hydrolase [Pseudomonas sp. MT4]QXY93631.1 alpha/beta fold hydrolase [Pseudomonas sp. MTM4]